jgi:hypothetical protein
MVSVNGSGHAGSFDVVVAGGGMAGVCAAVAAARSGARTLLLERGGFLGGVATAAAVVQFMGWKTAGGEQIIGGIAQEIADRLVAAGGSPGFGWYTMSTGMEMDRLEFDPEILKHVLDQMVIEAGVVPLFHSWVSRVQSDGRIIRKVHALTKSGELEFSPKVVIDATGDMDMLAAAQCEMLPLQAGEELQPASLMFRMGPIDFERFDAITTDEARAISTAGVQAEGLGRKALSCNRVEGTNDGWFNVTRLPVDGTDAFSLTRAEIEGRRQAFAGARFITAHVPGCENARMQALAGGVGVRETRRIKGITVVTEEDLRSGRVFGDAIGMSAFPIDLHHSGEHISTIERLGGESHRYTVPLSALIPVALDNALVAGRGMSATHMALAALRIMPTVMLMGQAAGVAAAHAARSAVPVADLPFEPIRAELEAAGAMLPGT